MLTLTTMLKAMRQKAEYGELDVAVPRDHAPASYYVGRRLRERAGGAGDASPEHEVSRCPGMPLRETDAGGGRAAAPVPLERLARDGGSREEDG